MSVYFVRNKGWRYDFTSKGERFTAAWFKTKAIARKAEAQKREELEKAKLRTETDMGFIDLVNRRLDHLKTYRSPIYYQETVYKARGWVDIWGELMCSDIKQEMVEKFILDRNRVSAQTANKEIRYLKATFNFGIRRKLIKENPVEGIDLIPVEKRDRFIPTPEHIDLVIGAADPETKDYLITIRETMGRVGEINRLTWEDVNLEGRYLTLYTRKKKGGNLTPRRIPLTKVLFDLLERRFTERDVSKSWVFWHAYTSSKTGEKLEGPYQDRKRIMRTLCKKAGVPYFRFHALRHCGASVMDECRISMGSIQRILGHENRTTTEIYLHAIRQSERDAMDAFEEAMAAKSHTKSHTETENGLTPSD